ncbi:MAG TPA: glycosyltransferase family 39 protein [Edaphobacter sp.]|nr:glycosyltransferase family 39 protein [Edaphobacter sp.]
MNRLSRASWVLLILMVAASFAIRTAAWAHWGTGTIESEGAEYAKIAENLRSGVGYVGIVSPGPQVLFNPLYPMLIAGTSLLTKDFELAGRLVSLFICALLPLPVFGIASRLFNRRVGFIASALAILHPLLVYLSFMVYSEGPYAVLLLSAIYLVIYALDDAYSAKFWLLIGGAFGLCYLLRAEAFAAFCISIVFGLFANGTVSTRLRRAAYAILVFLTMASPEIIFLHHQIGKFALETKSGVLFSYAGRRILAAETRPGMEYVSDGGNIEIPSPAPDVPGGYPERWEEKWATYSIDSHLKEMGFANRPFLDTARETHVRPMDTFPLVAKGLRQSVPRLIHNLASRWMGGPLLLALALMGAFRRSWYGRQAVLRFYFALVTAGPVAATVFVLWGDARYFFIFAPFLCIWAANGLSEASLWTSASIGATAWGGFARRAAFRWLVAGLLGAVIIIGSVNPAVSLYEFSDSAVPARIDKELGSWLGQRQNHPIRIMDLSLPLSYHADAQQHVYFPYCTGDLALRYLDSAKVDYIVLRHGMKFTRYYEDWLTQRIPDHRAELLQLPSIPGAEKYSIYAWHRVGQN